MVRKKIFSYHSANEYLNDVLNVFVRDKMQLVSARKVYGLISPEQDFAHWFSNTLNYGFVVNQDFFPIEKERSSANQRCLSPEDLFDGIVRQKMVIRTGKTHIA